MSVRYGNVYLPAPCAKRLRLEVVNAGLPLRVVIDRTLKQQIRQPIAYRHFKRRSGMVRFDLSVEDHLVSKLERKHAQWIKGRDPQQGTKPPGVAVMIAQILADHFKPNGSKS